MRILVFFDLPVVRTEERRAYRKFRKFLLRDGYDMIQFSVYSRLCSGGDAVDKHIARLHKNLPSSGSVRLLQLTDKQYLSMKVLLGELKPFEKNLSQRPVNIL